MKTSVEPGDHGIDRMREVDGERSLPAAHSAVVGQASFPDHALHSMQRSLGNRVTRRTLAAERLQSKLTVGAPDSIYEKEADTVAEQVTAARAPLAAAGAQRRMLRQIPIHTLQQSLGNRGLARLFRQTFPAPAIPELSRKCACGGEAKEECAECQKNRLARQRASIQAADSASPNRQPATGKLDGQHSRSGPQPVSLARQADDQNPPDGVAPDATTAADYGPADYSSQLSALSATVDHLVSVVNAVKRDQGQPGRTETVGGTWCNLTTGKAEWDIDRSRIPQCLWPCAERHEQTHAEFMRSPCERIWLPLERYQFWLHVAGPYAKQGNWIETKRAMDQAEAAVEEEKREVQWYLMYMDQTCRHDEGMAYKAGIEMCDTDEAKARCAKTGEMDQYNQQMAAWRRFMNNPPNCPAVLPPPQKP